MSANKKQNAGLVPKLRFPEFREAGEWWSVAPLGRLFSERQEAGFTNLPLLSLMDKEGIVPQEKTNRKNNSSADKSKYLRVLPGDIAYNTMRMWEGRSAYVGIEGLISPAYTVCIPAAKINGIFFSYYFKTEALIRQFRRYSQGLVKDTLNLKYEAFSRIEIAYPQGEREQQKIADCLTSIDDLIRLETEKLDAIKAHKKGLMQQLFPAEGETLPKLRFPEFRNAEEWRIQSFDHFVTRSFYGTSSSTSETGKYPVLRMGNMVDGGLSFSNLVYLDLDLESFESIRLLPGDILLNRTNSLALVGKISIFDRDIDCITASYIVTYRLDKAQIDPVFCNLMLNAPYYQAKINTLARPSVSQANINPTTFRKELLVSVPALAEQQRIADCLSTLDTQIATQAEKIEALKAHKKGLMQQLFPVLDEVPA